MTVRVSALGFAVLAAGLPSVAHAEGGLRGFIPEGSYYVRGEAGVTTESQVELSIRGTTTTEREINVPEGWTGAVGIGWASPTSGLRIEGIVEHSKAEADRTVQVTGYGAAPYTESYTIGGAFLMAHYDFMHDQRIQPSLGFGIGTVWYDNEIDMRPVTVGTTTTRLTSNWDSDPAFGLRATAAVSYVVSDRLVAELGYRFLYAEGLESTVRSGSTITTQEADISTHALTAALRYTFGRVGS